MTDPQSFDVAPFIDQDEGQHFDRKSLYEGPPNAKRSRDRRSVRDQVARYVAAFANAEGGVLILGLEDDGTPTGHSLPAKALKQLLQTPALRLSPPQSPGFVVEYAGLSLVVFEVPASDVPVQLHGNGFPLRIGDNTIEASERQVLSLKFHGMAESWESKPSPLPLNELDSSLVDQAKAGGGLRRLERLRYLLRRKMADRRGAGIVLRQAAELVFALDGPDHANAGVRIFRVVGTERRTGPEHNVEELPRIEGPLPEVIERAVEAISGTLRRPSRLVGTRFRPAPEYPDFAWKEALLNAIAHRDYSTEGRGVEVWLYDDRMEVVSPGGLMPEVALSALRTGQRVHSSRNPRTVRALVDLGFMRDQGEGIPRMFAEMEGSFLPEPELSVASGAFRVTLRNTPTLSAEDRAFVGRLEGHDLSPDEFRALLEAHRRGRVDNARMRRVAGLDTLQASRLLGKLRDRHLLHMDGGGSSFHYTLVEGLQVPDRGEPGPRAPADRGELQPDRGESFPDRGELRVDRGEPRLDRGESHPDRGEPPTDRGESTTRPVPPWLQRRIEALGTRPRKDKLRPILQALVQEHARSADELAFLIGRKSVKNLVERHLTPMVADRLLRRTQADPNHPDQAYRAATTPSLGPLFEEREDEP